MIKKKGRGGARKDAGRKRVIQEDDRTWIEIGIACEFLQKEVPGRVAYKARENRSVAKKIKKFQTIVVERRVTDPRQRDQIWELVFKKSRPTDWVAGLKGRRVATREQIIAIVSDGYMKKGRLRITTRQVRESWYRYRRLIKKGANPSDEPTEADLIAMQSPG
jgi:hypothetical protein